MYSAPVVLLGYARPKETKQIIDRINQSRTKKVYFFVDYPNDITDAKLFKLNNEVKELSSCFDSSIVIESCFFEKNLGVFEAINQSTSIVFKKEEEVIFLEDDKLPSLCFFDFCSELLEKYRNDERILFISGMNTNSSFLNNYKYDYFFAELNTNWGHAIWKRTYDKYKFSLEFINDDYYKNLIQQIYKLKHNKHDVINEVLSYINKGTYNGHVASGEFFMMGPLRILTNTLVIVPSKNLISDTGATEYTVHGDEFHLMTRGQKKLFFRETFELISPLKHPPYVISDYRFNKVPYLPFRRFFWLLDKIERAYLILKYKGFKSLVKRFRRIYKIRKNKDYLDKS